MKSAAKRPMAVGVVLTAVAAFAACGEDTLPEVPPLADARAPEGAAPPPPPVTDATPRDDGAPVRAKTGIDTRPANPTCLAPPRPAPPRRGFKLTEVFVGAGLDEPTGMAQLPGDRGRMFFIERAGKLVSIPTSGAPTKRVVATMPDPVTTVGELGMFGFAFHPRFAQNGYVYFLYFRPALAPLVAEAVIVRMRSTDGGASFGEATRIYGPFGFSTDHHVAGDLHFGTDGYLYASFGDDSDPTNGQKTTRVQSKLVRIDVDSASPYAIPDTNPFKSGGGEPSTFAYGFRNPFRFSIDPANGNIWVADVGEGAIEELDLAVAGGNYGFAEREGANCYPPEVQGCKTAGLIDPVIEHDHTNDKVFAIMAGPVYRGDAMPSHKGELVYWDFSTTKLFTLGADPRTGAPVSTLQAELGTTYLIDDIAEGDDHELYAVSLLGGVYRIEDASEDPVAPSLFPDKLSKTGCFSATSPRTPVEAMIPYDVAAPFWSDDATKERFFAIPDGTTIDVKPDGDLDFPPRSVLAKHFRLGGRLVETRLFVRHDDGEWGGYSYAWDEDERDATLVGANGRTSTFRGVPWTFPSRGDCFRCHTAAAGRSLGLELAQLNIDALYTRTNRIANPIATMSHLGLFTTPVGPAATWPSLPSPDGTAPIEARARAYLHANCSHCHRPGGGSPVAMDLRYTTSLAATKTCGITPTGSDLGIAGAKLVAPGDPPSSLLVRRMRSTTSSRMPPLGSRKVDEAGARVLEGFVRGLSACPQ
ncbi:MAG: PQQ-dependent sugar dehydrogenase [Polyangiaceae bacterium]